jgi:predicted metalloprotease
MRLDQLPRSENVEDRRGEIGRGGGGIRIPGGRGGLGIGTIILLVLLGWWLGIDPSVLIGAGDVLTGGGRSQQQTQNAPDQTQADAGGASDQTKEMVSAVLGSTEVVWGKMFQESGKQYEPPTLVMFSEVTRSGCGFAQSAMGPFYCPLDRKVYLDTSFFRDLERRFHGCDAGSKACQFSQAYVGQSLRAGMAVHRAWRRGSSNADRFSDWRRPDAAPKPGLCRARCLHSRLVRPAHALVHERTEIGKG